MAKLNFQQALLQSLVLHDPSEILVLIIINVKNRFAA